MFGRPVTAHIPSSMITFCHVQRLGFSLKFPWLHCFLFSYKSKDCGFHAGGISNPILSLFRYSFIWAIERGLLN